MSVNGFGNPLFDLRPKANVVTAFVDTVQANIKDQSRFPFSFFHITLGDEPLQHSRLLTALGPLIRHLILEINKDSCKETNLFEIFKRAPILEYLDIQTIHLSEDDEVHDDAVAQDRVGLGLGVGLDQDELVEELFLISLVDDQGMSVLPKLRHLEVESSASIISCLTNWIKDLPSLAKLRYGKVHSTCKELFDLLENCRIPVDLSIQKLYASSSTDTVFNPHLSPTDLKYSMNLEIEQELDNINLLNLLECMRMRWNLVSLKFTAPDEGVSLQPSNTLEALTLMDFTQLWFYNFLLFNGPDDFELLTRLSLHFRDQCDIKDRMVITNLNSGLEIPLLPYHSLFPNTQYLTFIQIHSSTFALTYLGRNFRQICHLNLVFHVGSELATLSQLPACLSNLQQLTNITVTSKQNINALIDKVAEIGNSIRTEMMLSELA